MTAEPRLLAYGDRAVLVELADTATVVAWADALRAAAIEGVADVIPAAETVLVVSDPHADVAALRSKLARISADSVEEGRAAVRETIDIDVHYDGPDLDEVCALTGLDRAGVVEAHTGTPWRVAFGGFAPGFAYLVGGDERLQVPRRDEARTNVPAGSVGLAGEFSGVYPRASPGGWQLIGTTEQILWDLDRDPPALLEAGAVVRFVDVAGR